LSEYKQLCVMLTMVNCEFELLEFFITVNHDEESKTKDVELL